MLRVEVLNRLLFAALDLFGIDNGLETNSVYPLLSHSFNNLRLILAAHSISQTWKKLLGKTDQQVRLLGNNTPPAIHNITKLGRSVAANVEIR